MLLVKISCFVIGQHLGSWSTGRLYFFVVFKMFGYRARNLTGTGCARFELIAVYGPNAVVNRRHASVFMIMAYGIYQIVN